MKHGWNYHHDPHLERRYIAAKDEGKRVLHSTAGLIYKLPKSQKGKRQENAKKWWSKSLGVSVEHGAQVSTQNHLIDM